MHRRRSTAEPIAWLLFSSGGMVSALLLPVLMLLFGVLFPLGLVSPPEHAHLLAVLTHPIIRLVLFALMVLSLFHWAHRFRYTLFEGLQLRRLSTLITTLCYGGAIVGTAIAGWLLFGA
jgi:fumarate reductase subunit D